MKTVKRKAEVGEKVRSLKSGRVGTVVDVSLLQGHVKAIADTGDTFIQDPENYEVIIENETEEIELLDRETGEFIKRPVEPPHSSHYHQNGLDPLEVMRRAFPPEQYEGFLRGSLLKYTMRYDRKGQEAEDLEKMNFYGKELEVFKRQQHD